MSEKRQNPEELLRRVQDEERKEKRGKLKIYLGAAPGVGKTYQMLQDAMLKRQKGLDVVVGIAESHGRHDIESMLGHLECLPRQVVNYHRHKLHELDLDGALQRCPGLIIVDEMAHTNAPGLRHTKRWQDIQEILDHGIDVYTTLNVQHIESLNDDVAQIIQAPIKETVPDSMIDAAETLELIDLPPDDLLKRLQEGKVYIPQQAELALEHFFRKGNLIALRELALRTTAEHVGAAVLMYRQGEGIQPIWAIKDKILVCVSSSLESLKLIRAAKRAAHRLQAEWIAVYVDKAMLRFSVKKRNQAIQNLRLAELLGAQTHVLPGFDVVKEIMRFSRENNVTQIMIWKNVHPRGLDWMYRDLANEMIRQSKAIGVYVLTGESVSRAKPAYTKPTVPWEIYGVAVGVVGLVTLINLILASFLAPSGLLTFYFLGLTGVALFGRIGPSIAASLLSCVAYQFLFSQAPHGVTLVVMFVVAQIISVLIILTRRQAESARLIQSQTSALYALSRQLTTTWGVEALLETGTRYIANAFDSEVFTLLPRKGRLEVRSSSKSNHTLGIKELSIAEWVYDGGKIAGLGTDTLAFSKALYLPLLASQGPIGVLRICPETQQLFTPDQMRLLESCANQLALALENDRLQKKATKKEWKLESERVRSTLLQTISQSLRTPLRTVIGAASNLMDIDGNPFGDIEHGFYLEIEHLSRLNNNILHITQLESQALQLDKIPASLKDVIIGVVEKLDKYLKNRPVHINAHEQLPPVLLNKMLLEEVLINLIDNAIKFCPPGSPIDISVQAKQDCVVVSVDDYGPGIAPDETQKVFEKFYRGKHAKAERGLGLGLAICQKIIKVHGGEIWVENRKEGGASFRFTLPLTAV